MIALLTKTENVTQASISIAGSKSESNRLLILQALHPEITINNISTSDDTKVLQHALSTQDEILDVHHAGTAMRFLTAYLAATTNKIITLTGSSRMQERPIGVLVEALQSMGAKIKYVGKDGFPPIQISPAVLTNNVTIQAHVSSQYISALLLIGSKLPEGLIIQLQGEITSRSYIEMTLALLKKVGVSCTFKQQTISVKPLVLYKDNSVAVEADWSSASYFYSAVALSKNLKVRLSSFKKESLQGDAALLQIYKQFGVHTKFIDATTLEISKQKTDYPNQFVADLSNTPDIAQTIAVTCFGLHISCHLTGLHTLKIKETDRLVALQTELEKFNAQTLITDSSFTLTCQKEVYAHKKQSLITVATYQDHRMAMAFAPLALLFPIAIAEPMVVSKSYPNFYKDLSAIGIKTAFSKL